MSRRRAPSFKDYVGLKETHEKRVAKILSGYKSDNSKQMADKKRSFEKRQVACASCNKPSRVGTIFTETADAYEARCGHETAPCSLSMRVAKTHTRSVFDVMREVHDEYREANTRLLSLQMDAVYELGAESETLDAYEAVKREMEAHIKAYQRCVEQYDGHMNREYTREKREAIAAQMDRGLAEVDALLHPTQQPRSGSAVAVKEADVKEAVSIYQTNVYPNAARMRALEKPLRRVDVNVDNTKKTIVSVVYEHAAFTPEDMEMGLYIRSN